MQSDSVNSLSCCYVIHVHSRHNIGQLRMCGEASAVNEQTVESWRQQVPGLLHGYSDDDIYNADETGLFFKCLPNKTLAYKNEACHGGKMSKERITVLPIMNMSGKSFCF